MMKSYKQYSDWNWRKRLSNWLGVEYARLRRDSDELSGYKLAINNSLSEEFSASWKDYIYASEIVSGFDLLSQRKNFNKRNIEKGVDSILDNQIYDKYAIYNDLTPILRKIISQDIIEKINLSSVDDLSLEAIFSKLVDLYSLDYLDIDELLVAYNEINEFFIHRDQNEFRLKTKALAEFLESHSQIIHEHGQHKIYLELPIIFHLREFLDLINSLKDLSLRECDKLRDIVNYFKFYKDGFRIRDKCFMLAYKGQRE